MSGFDFRLIQTLKDALSLDQSQVKKMNQVLKTLQMQIPLQAMALQDCINVAIFFIRTTIEAQMLTVGIRGCGGPIDVATITRRHKLQFVQRKEVHGQKDM